MLAYKVSRVYEIHGGENVDVDECGYFLRRSDAVKELVDKVSVRCNVDKQKEVERIEDILIEHGYYETEEMDDYDYYEIEEIIIYE